MGGCRNRSEQIPFVPHDPLMIGAVYNFGPPFSKSVIVEFDVPMDQTSLPDVNDWDVLVDGVPKPMTGFVWGDPTHVAAIYGDFGDPLVDGFIRLNADDVDCKTLEGAHIRAPQIQQYFP